jgi:hypothetical protein
MPTKVVGFGDLAREYTGQGIVIIALNYAGFRRFGGIERDGLG